MKDFENLKDFDKTEFQAVAIPALKSGFFDKTSWAYDVLYEYATETDDEDEEDEEDEDYDPEVDYDDVMEALEVLLQEMGAKQAPPEVTRFLDFVYALAVENEDEGRINDWGSIYYTGQIGTQDFKKAAELYLIADRLGNANATCNLGYIYYYGRTGEVDYEKAYLYFSKSAMRDKCENSLYKIGDMYRNGYFVAKDEKAAFEIYMNAYRSYRQEKEKSPYDYDWAVEADVNFRLGDCKMNGIGTEKDLMEALMYLQCAERGFVERVKRGDYFLRKMLRSTIEKQAQIREELSKELPDMDWAKDVAGYDTL